MAMWKRGGFGVQLVGVPSNASAPVLLEEHRFDEDLPSMDRHPLEQGH